MDVSTMLSTGAYLKKLELQTKWKLRQESGDFTGRARSLDQWISDQEEQKETNPVLQEETAPWKDLLEGEDHKIQGIYQKLFCGKKLTSEEKALLQGRDPLAYEKARGAEEARKRYEQALKRCRTKEDVQRLKMTHLSSSMAAVNAIRNDPNISDDKKLAWIAQENGKATALAKITQEFVQRGYYGRLPTQAEEAQAAEALEEAQRAPLRPQEGKEPQQGEVQNKETFDELDQTAIRKVKRAKAVAAYARLDEVSHPDPPSVTGEIPSLDTQV